MTVLSSPADLARQVSFAAVLWDNLYVQILSGPAIIRHPERLRANEWITLSASRHAQNGELVVNDGHREVGRSPGSTQGVNLKTPMYVGGVDKTKVKVHPDAGVSHGFEGCVAHVSLHSVY